MQFRTKSTKVWLVIALALAVMVVGLGACSSDDDDAVVDDAVTDDAVTDDAVTDDVVDEPAADKPLITIADNQFESLWINNAIIKYIIEEGYGYETETIQSTTSISQLSLENGDFDIWMELWQQNMIEWYDEAISKGTIENLGPTYEGGPQFFMIPQWVHEQYAINTIDDMKDHWELFADPEDSSKGAFYNCIIGWQCAVVNDIKLEAYGITDYYNVISPGASGAMEAVLHAAQLKEEPIFSYYWAPTAIMGMYDWYILEEPAYDADVWAKIAAAQTDGSLRPIDEAVAYETLPVDKGVNSELREKAPDIYAMLEQANVGLQPINVTAAWAITEEIAGEWELAAIYYLTNWEDRWSTWVTDEAFDNIKAALAAD